MTQEDIEHNNNELEKVRKYLIDNNLKITDARISNSHPVYGLGRRDPIGYRLGYYNVNLDCVLVGDKEDRK